MTYLAGNARDRFLSPRAAQGEAITYLCGHSLGLQPTNTHALMAEGLGMWSDLAVDGHFEGAKPWFSLGEDLRPMMARIVGANAADVVLHASLTINLHLLLTSFYRPTGRRTKILMERGAFPSDRFALHSHAASRGYPPDTHVIEVVGSGPLEVPTSDEIVAAIEAADETLATVLLPGVVYSTGAVYDIARITAAAHRVGATIGWDLAHAVGNIALQLEADGVDFATWCTYKYLNGGPGAVGGLFVHPVHTQDRGELARFEGWWGHKASTRFQPNMPFDASDGAAAWQLSNVPVFSLLPLYASLPIFDEVGMTALAEAGRHLHRRMREGLAQARRPIALLTPADAYGTQLSIALPGRAQQVQQQLASRGFLCDTRGADVLRAAAAPLYTTETDVDAFSAALVHILETTDDHGKH